MYIKKWNKQISMSEYIGLFLYLFYYINNSGQKLDNTHIVHAILFFAMF